jgi:hypothetical protein
VFDDEVEALCVASGVLKRFRLDRLKMPDTAAMLSAYVAETMTPDDRPLEDVLREALPELEALGWHVAIENNGISLQVLRFFKNGKPRKPLDVVGLSYAELTHDYIDFDGQEVMRKSARPYSVWSQRSPTRTFAERRSALVHFLKEARALTPRGQSGE